MHLPLLLQYRASVSVTHWRVDGPLDTERVSSADIDKVAELARAGSYANLAIDNSDDKLKYIGGIFLDGAGCGAAVGLMGSAAELAAMRMLPSRYKAPLIGAAIMKPLLGASIGALRNCHLEDKRTQDFTNDQFQRATQLINSGLLSDTVRSMREYEATRQQGF